MPKAYYNQDVISSLPHRHTFIEVLVTFDENNKPILAAKRLAERPHKTDYDQYGMIKNQDRKHTVHIYIRGALFPEWQFHAVSDMLDARIKAAYERALTQDQPE